MSTNKKERVMSPKGFLHKTTTKAAASASAFIQAHRTWLLTGELAKVTAPILAKIDSKELMPTPALEEIKGVVLNHMIASEIRKGEEAMARRDAVGESEPKNWIATIFNSKGEIQTRINAKGESEDLQTSFELGQDAERWCDRRLVEGAPDWFGTVTHATMVGKSGDPISSTITRGDAFARVLKQAPGAVMRKVGGTTSSLSFRPKAKGDHFHFSKG